MTGHRLLPTMVNSNLSYNFHTVSTSLYMKDDTLTSGATNSAACIVTITNRTQLGYSLHKCRICVYIPCQHSKNVEYKRYRLLKI